jgi:probable HAF family extracellular repeat protein
MNPLERFLRGLGKVMVALPLSLIVGQGTGAVAAPVYIAQDLGLPKSDQILPTGINNAGQVVGRIGSFSPNVHAFLYDQTGLRDLGTLGSGDTWASAINDAGQVVGWSGTSAGVEHAFLFDGTGMRDLGTLGGRFSHANGINKMGQVVGFAETGGGAHAFLYDSTGMHDLGTLGGVFSTASGINNVGQVVGSVWPTDAVAHAFLYDSTGMHDLGSFGGTRCFAGAINDAGQVVGLVEGDRGFRHAFFYDRAGVRELAPLVPGGESAALAINAAGQVVGWSPSAGGLFHAVLWENGQIHDLNDLLAVDIGQVLQQARSINDAGQIVCEAPEGVFLLTPSTAPLPTSSAAVSPLPNAAGWNNRDVTVTLSATAGSTDADVASITYSATGAQSIPTTTVSGASTSIRVTTEGETTVTYFARGKAGITERAKTVTIRLDKTPPTTTAIPSPLPNADGGNNGDVTVTLGAVDNDGGAGVAAITYRTAGAQPSPKTTVSGGSGAIRVAITAQGQTTLTYYPTDVAGNIEPAQTLTLRIDKKSAPANSTAAGAPPAAYDDLCDLTRQLVANAKVAGALCAKLQAAKAAAARGAKKKKKNAIAEFVTRVKKLKGKGLTAAQADTLIRAARAL